jgi:hypothetical protein
MAVDEIPKLSTQEIKLASIVTRSPAVQQFERTTATASSIVITLVTYSGDDLGETSVSLHHYNLAIGSLGFWGSWVRVGLWVELGLVVPNPFVDRDWDERRRVFDRH